MAISFFTTEISDLCLGKPPLRSLPTTATVSDAVNALKRSGEIYVSVWRCDRSDSVAVVSNDNYDGCCRCVGKICMVDVIVYLCKEENLLNPFDALQSNVLDLLPKVIGQIRHLEPKSSLLEAIDCILEGAQNLVIPIYTTNSTTNPNKNHLTKPPPSLFNHALPPHHTQNFCWLTQEDVVRFLLNSISLFSPTPSLTIEALDIIDNLTLTVNYNDPAITALPLITRSLLDQTSIGVVNQDNHLIGEISPFTLACCDETIAAAVTTLSAGDLMVYIDYNGPSDDLVHLVKARLQQRNLGQMLDLMEDCYNPLISFSSSSSCCSSDEEFGPAKNGCVGRFYPGRRSETIVCHPWNSLMAVMVQMIALRVSYAWVVQQDYTLVGIVTFAEILRQFRSVAGDRS